MEQSRPFDAGVAEAAFPVSETETAGVTACHCKPMVTRVGELYVGPQPQYLRGIANIRFAVEEMKAVQPNADSDHLTVVGHSAGADISMYFAKLHPEEVKNVVALDNLRVPL